MDVAQYKCGLAPGAVIYLTHPTRGLRGVMPLWLSSPWLISLIIVVPIMGVLIPAVQANTCCYRAKTELSLLSIYSQCNYLANALCYAQRVAHPMGWGWQLGRTCTSGGGLSGLLCGLRQSFVSCLGEKAVL